ncbi:MAG: VCBS repeat-containing protein, partial [Cyclobacteriaceae bacterium]
NSFNAFNAEKLIPHMLSTQGPKIAVGDINGDKMEDFFIGGATGQSGQIFIQHKSGNFFRTPQPALELDSLQEDIGAAFFDADGNGTLDLIVVSGGQEFPGNHANLLPRLYLNNGKGVFKKSRGNLPEIFVNASCVKPTDIEGDGDIDLFIGGRVVVGEYGISPGSYILINNGKGLFTNGSSMLPGGKDDDAGYPGMVTDAVWSDLNQDGKPDLIVVGEWMPVTILIQDVKGTFQNKTHEYGLGKTNGWWNTITASDFDKDGDMDFAVGNLGLNSRLKAGTHEPVSLYVGDIDNNGGIDHILACYNQGERYPFISRDQLVRQVPSLKRTFLKYSNFRNVILEDIIPTKDTGKYVVNNAFIFASVYLENTRNGKFSIAQLPVEAQMFPVFSFSEGDFNDDGHTDILAVGNLYAVQPEFGRYDAGYGLMMLGDGKGNFRSLSQQSSGFVVKGEGRDIQYLVNSIGKKIYLVSRNNDGLLIYENQ